MAKNRPAAAAARKSETLTGAEAEFLELPASQLAITLFQRSHNAELPKHPVLRWLATSKGRLLAASAFIAAVLPLYEINQAAWRYLATRMQVTDLVDQAEKLVDAGAVQPAEQVLARARDLRDGDLRVAQLQAALDIEKTLRSNQTPMQLRTLEIQYRDVLRTDARSNYLLGTAWIGADSARAEALFDQAARNNRKNVPQLDVLLCSGRIWNRARRAEKVSSADRKTVIQQAEELYAAAQKTIENNKGVDFERSTIALNQSHAMVLELKARAGDQPSEEQSISLQRQVLNQAMATGSPLLIGKASAALAAKFKDGNRMLEARTLIRSAIRYAELAEDTRGLYHNQYTLGQIQLLNDELAEAEHSLSASLELAERNADLRLQCFAFATRSQSRLLLGKVAEASQDIAQAGALADLRNDRYGVEEAKFLSALATLISAKSKDDYSEALKRMQKVKQETIDAGLQVSANWWSKAAEYSAPASMPTGSYDPKFELKIFDQWKASGGDKQIH